MTASGAHRQRVVRPQVARSWSGVAKGMVPRGLEPRTLRLLAVRSNQLSYDFLAMALQCQQQRM